MMLKLLSVSLYAMKWLTWLLTYAVIWPAALLMLLIILIFRMDNTTPGEEMAREIAAVTRNVSNGEYRISICRDKSLIPSAPQHKSSDLSLSDAPSAVCRDGRSVITDAKGYAAGINGSLRVFTTLWAFMAIVFAGLALLMGYRPYFYWCGQMRSACVRYGIPASYPVSATGEVKTPDIKEREHE